MMHRIFHLIADILLVWAGSAFALVLIIAALRTPDWIQRLRFKWHDRKYRIALARWRRFEFE